MFSAFPESRDVNPKHWDSKLQFWRTVIIDSCDSSDELFIDAGLLKSRFRRNGVSPLGLGTVLGEMLSKGEIMSVNDFLESVYDSWGSWSYGMAKKTFWWSVGKIWPDSNELNGSFILVSLVKVSMFLVSGPLVPLNAISVCNINMCLTIMAGWFDSLLRPEGVITLQPSSQWEISNLKKLCILIIKN